MCLFVHCTQRRKGSGNVFVPTTLKNLLVTGVFGDKVRLISVPVLQ